MKILITGANGQVGYCLQQSLNKTSHQFIALTKEQLDISNVDAVNQLVNEIKPQIIINAAAYTAVDKAESDIEKAFNINRDGPANLAQAAKNNHAVIFHISTDYVFAGDKETPYNEDDLTDPQGIYGKSKLEGEQAVIKNNEKHIILRTAWVFGEHGNNFVKTMIRLGKIKKELGVVADQFGGPTYAGDIADALVDVANIYSREGKLAWGIYHFAGEPHVNWYEFASLIFDKADVANILPDGKPLVKAIATADYPTPAKRPHNSRLNCQKISQAFNIKPSKWQSALANIAAYNC